MARRALRADRYFRSRLPPAIGEVAPRSGDHARIRANEPIVEHVTAATNRSNTFHDPVLQRCGRPGAMDDGTIMFSGRTSIESRQRAAGSISTDVTRASRPTGETSPTPRPISITFIPAEIPPRRTAPIHFAGEIAGDRPCKKWKPLYLNPTQKQFLPSKRG